MTTLQALLEHAETRVGEPVFGEVPVRGGPSVGAFVLSIGLHGLAMAGAVTIPLTMPSERPKQPVVEAKPTVVRIADHLYYVNEINPPERDSDAPKKEKSAQQAKVKAAATPKSVPKEPPKPAELASAAQASAGLRQFIPPDARKNPNSDVTLIQPLLPPAELTTPPQVPTMMIATAEIQRRLPPKTFVVPGRQTPTPPDPLQPIQPPNLDLTHTDPLISTLQPFAVLPPNWPAPADAPIPNPKSTVPPPLKQGDPVEIVALNPRPVAPTEELVVPPGNIVGRNGDGNNVNPGNAVPAPGSATPGANPPAGNRNPANPLPGTPASGTPASGNPASGNPASGNPAPGNRSGAPPARANDKGPASTPAAPPATPGAKPGSDGVRAAVPPKPSSVEVTILGSGVRRKPNNDNPVIIRPANGTFDAMIVQSSPLDQIPESRGMLTGRPVYTVYFSLETSKDWTFYFCANSKQSPDGDAAPAIQAPYPTRLVRPQIDLPTYLRYVLVHGTVNAEGRFENLKLVKSVRPETDQALLTALAGWEFRAATRDGVKAPVEFLLSIPVAGL